MRKLILLLAALGALLVAAPAQAAKITGGTTTVTPSAAALKVLSDNGIAAAPLAPATFADGTFTFPIAKGKVNAKLHGYILHRGGLKLSKGDKSVALRRFILRSTRRGAVLAAQVGKAKCHVVRRHRGRHHRRGVRRVVCVLRYAVVARLTDAQRSGNTVTATVKITRLTARYINHLAGSKVVAAGATLGTATIAPTLKS